MNEAFTSFDSFRGFRSGYRLRRQHRGQGPGLPLRCEPFEQCRLHRRYLQQAQEYFGPARLSRHRQLQDLGRGRTQAGQGQVLLGHAAGAGQRSRHRADQRHRVGIVDAILSGTGRLPRPRRPLNPVTIDARTLRTNYNVLDNHSGAEELWLRGGFDWDITNNVTLKSQVYRLRRPAPLVQQRGQRVQRQPHAVAGAQGDLSRTPCRRPCPEAVSATSPTCDRIPTIAGMDNRLVTTFAASSLHFNVSQDTSFNQRSVTLVNPDRGFYGSQQTKSFIRTSTMSRCRSRTG